MTVNKTAGFCSTTAGHGCKLSTSNAHNLLPVLALHTTGVLPDMKCNFTNWRVFRDRVRTVSIQELSSHSSLSSSPALRVSHFTCFAELPQGIHLGGRKFQFVKNPHISCNSSEADGNF